MEFHTDSKKKCPRCSAVPLEAYKVGMAQAGDTHILEESWRNPDPKGKWFIKNPTFPPGQPPNSLRRKSSLASWLTGCQDTYKESIWLTYQSRKQGYQASLGEWNTLAPSDIRSKSPRRREYTFTWCSWTLLLPLAQSFTTSSGLLLTCLGYQLPSQASSRPTSRMCSYV